jgi:KaiC/GvpD/RAD55 family RecA-like ATPase
MASQEMLERVAQLRSEKLDHNKATPIQREQLVPPLTAAARNLLEVLDDRNERYMLGLPQIDFLTRGFGDGELVLIQGFAHSGKTQLLLSSIINNLDKRIVLFSMDDSTEMILTNLICMYEGITAETLEQAVKSHDNGWRDKVVDHASKTFQNLVVCDTPMPVPTLDVAVQQVTTQWGEAPDMVAIDYLQSVPKPNDDNDSVRATAQQLKRWVKGKPWPLIVLHQGTRSGSRPGQPITILSGAYAGEQEATFIVGVRRQKDRDDDDFTWENRKYHQDKVTLHVVKNKRPPSKSTPYEGVDFHMDKTGRIRPLTIEVESPEEAVSAVQGELV